MQNLIVSVSLGSSERDATRFLHFDGKTYEIRRTGTNGSLLDAQRLLRELNQNPQVAAIGLGGIDLFVSLGKQRYAFRDAAALAACAPDKPVADGSRLKRTLEPLLVRHLHEQQPLTGKRGFAVSSVDRWHLSEALVSCGVHLRHGDLAAIGLPFPLRSMSAVSLIGRSLLPVITKLPFHYLYPTGKQQDAPKRHCFSRAVTPGVDLLAGDFHYVERYAPEDLSGKLIITNTVRKRNREALFARGLSELLCTTPIIEGDSFGTNVIEALCCAICSSRAPCEAELLALFEYAGWDIPILHTHP